MSLINTTPIYQFTPNFFSNCKIWLKANTGITLGGAPATDGGAVDNWSDQSGNGLNLSQATSANRPTFRTGVLNGYSVIETDGVNDCLSRAFTWNQPNHLFIVWRTLAVPAVFRWFGSNGIVNWNAYEIFGTYNLFAGVPGCGITGFTNNVWNISECLFNQDNSLQQRNGDAQAIGDVSTTNTDGFTLGDQYDGAGGGVNGQFAEVIGYSSQLSNSRREMVRNYLNSKFAVY